MKLTFCRRRYTLKKEEEEESNWYKKLIQKKETYGADKRIGRQKSILERLKEGLCKEVKQAEE